jgi:hypothetical protein
MKTKRQKHKAAKARSIAARAAKKQQKTAGSESETSDVAPTPDPPKKKPKLERSSPRKSVNQPPLPAKQTPGVALDKSRSRTQGTLPRESKVTDVKTKLRSKPEAKKK